MSNLSQMIRSERTLQRTAPGSTTISGAAVRHTTGRSIQHTVTLSNLFDDPATATTTTSVGAVCTVKVQAVTYDTAGSPVSYADITGLSQTVTLADRGKVVVLEIAATVAEGSRVQIVRNANFPIGIDSAECNQLDRTFVVAQGTNVMTPVIANG
jgi:hypothetical protein